MQHSVKFAFAPLQRMLPGPHQLDRNGPTIPAVTAAPDPDGLMRAIALAVPISAALWSIAGIFGVLLF